MVRAMAWRALSTSSTHPPPASKSWLTLHNLIRSQNLIRRQNLIRSQNSNSCLWTAERLGQRSNRLTPRSAFAWATILEGTVVVFFHATVITRSRHIHAAQYFTDCTPFTVMAATSSSAACL